MAYNLSKKGCGDQKAVPVLILRFFIAIAILLEPKRGTFCSLQEHEVLV